MIRCKPGDVVLVRFPFTDLTSSKRRPALVISPATYTSRRGDVIVLALTSQPQRDSDPRLKSWREAGLPMPTWIKPLLATVSAQIVDKRLGRIAAADRPRVTRAIGQIIASEFLPD